MLPVVLERPPLLACGTLFGNRLQQCCHLVPGVWQRLRLKAYAPYFLDARAGVQ
jgi:hypothetical protein